MSWRNRPTELEGFRSELERGWPPGIGLVVLPTVGSTNTLARRSLESGPIDVDPAPTAYVAWEQTAGRGRRGRRWSSPPGGGVYATVLAPLRTAGMLEILPLLVPVALCRALRSAGVASCGLKWPNDLVVEGRKVGGVLIEAVSAGGEPRAAIVGFGINYRTPDDAELATSAIGVAELIQPPPSLAAVARRLLDPLLDRLGRLETERLSDVVGSYRELSVHRAGDRLACRTAAETLEGAFAGFDDRGLLRLSVGAGERRIAAADIVER